MGTLTISRHPAKFGGDWHYGNRDLTFLMVDQQNGLYAAYLILSLLLSLKAYGMSTSPARNFRLTESFSHNHFSSLSNEISSALVTHLLGNNL